MPVLEREPDAPLSMLETRRYARHLVLKSIGGAGQQRLKSARILVVGAGGLGCPVIAYLAAAGVGTIGIVDDDRVALSNLQRQVLYATDDVGELKAEGAAQFVRKLNPHVALEVHPVRLTATDAAGLISGYDVVVDGTDNFATRRLSARTARALGIPLVTGAVSMLDGQMTVFMPTGPQLEDLYPFSPDDEDAMSCEQVGVLGAITGVIGSLMAVEAIKLASGLGTAMAGRLLLFDGAEMRFIKMTYGRGTSS